MGDQRLISKEEGILLKKQGKLKCPGAEGEEPCGNYMTDFRVSARTDKPMLKPEMYCSLCDISLRLYQI